MHGPFDRGIPDSERIVLQAQQAVNLGQFGLLIGVQTGEHLAVPLPDNFFWLGDGFLGAGEWLFVYTGPGEPRATTFPNRPERVYIVHWGRQQTIFNHSNIVPVLFRMDGVIVP